MRIVSWNFLEGGFGPSDSDEHREPLPARRKAALSLVETMSPDVLILNEALYAQSWAGQLEDYARLFDFPYQMARLYDKAWGNTILSRFPIQMEQERLIHRETGQNRGWIATLITPPGGVPTWISTYHPHPQRRPHKRAEDFREFLSLMQGHPAVLMGDLNAINPADRPDEGVLLENFLRFQSPGVAELSVQRMIESGRLLFEKVLPQYHWRDGMPAIGRRPSLPTALIRRPDDSGLRIDHALVSSGIQVLGGEVCHSKLADLSSDHYPIVLEIA